MTRTFLLPLSLLAACRMAPIDAQSPAPGAGAPGLPDAGAQARPDDIDGFSPSEGDRLGACKADSAAPELVWEFQGLGLADSDMHGHELAVVGAGFGVHIFDARTAETVRNLDLWHTGTAVALAEDAVWVGKANGEVRRVDRRTGQGQLWFQGDGPVLDLDVAPSGAVVAVFEDGQDAAWIAQPDGVIDILGTELGGLETAHFLADGRLALGGQDAFGMPGLELRAAGDLAHTSLRFEGFGLRCGFYGSVDLISSNAAGTQLTIGGGSEAGDMTIVAIVDLGPEPAIAWMDWGGDQGAAGAWTVDGGQAVMTAHRMGGITGRTIADWDQWLDLETEPLHAAYALDGGFVLVGNQGLLQTMGCPG